MRAQDTSQTISVPTLNRALTKSLANHEKKTRYGGLVKEEDDESYMQADSSDSGHYASFENISNA